MKLITPYLIKYTISIGIWTLAFRYALSLSLQSQFYIAVISSSIIYGTLMFLTGWYFGKKDGEYLPIFDVGFRFHLITYLVHNSVSVLWVTLGPASAHESINVILWTAAYWGFFLILHFIFFLFAKKRTIDNLDKKNLFD